jgi:transcription antitermination factor NusG
MWRFGHPAFQPGFTVWIISGGFAGTYAIFLEMDGERRAILLKDMLNPQQADSLVLVDIATR